MNPWCLIGWSHSRHIWYPVCINTEKIQLCNYQTPSLSPEHCGCTIRCHSQWYTDTKNQNNNNNKMLFLSPFSREPLSNFLTDKSNMLSPTLQYGWKFLAYWNPSQKAFLSFILNYPIWLAALINLTDYLPDPHFPPCRHCIRACENNVLGPSPSLSSHPWEDCLPSFL
jgi:hypothetical protein